MSKRRVDRTLDQEQQQRVEVASFCHHPTKLVVLSLPLGGVTATITTVGQCTEEPSLCTCIHAYTYRQAHTYIQAGIGFFVFLCCPQVDDSGDTWL